MDIKVKLIEIIAQSEPMLLTQAYLSNSTHVHVKGVHGALKAFFLANLYATISNQILYISAESEQAEELKEELQQIVDRNWVSYFPPSVFYGTGFDHHNHETIKARLATLELLAENNAGIIVAHASSLLNQLPDPGAFANKKISISVNQVLDFEDLIAVLINLGFVRESRVEHVGEMCVRGGIIDIFPYSSEYPYRIEFWDNLVESIRTFDPDTQRSLETIKSLSVFPQEIESVGEEKENCRKINILRYVSENAIVVLDEPERIKRQILENGISYSNFIFKDQQELWANVEKNLTNYNQVHFISIGQQYSNLVDFKAKACSNFKGNLKDFKICLGENAAAHNGFKVFFSCDSDNQTERMIEIFDDEEIKYANLYVVNLGLHKGFLYPEANLAIYTDHEFYGRVKRLRLPKRRFKGLTPKQLKHLNVGDYIVHVDFGIGIFRGLKKITVQGHERECLKIEYRDGDLVYVRIERMDRVNKYSSRDTATPQLHKLGSQEWQKLKARTKKKIKDIAKDLIEIYAKRKAQPGFAFAEDTLWQRELEASFPYEDTPDQIKATEDVKRDMESPLPMDRLICGDVGFGKTEIAVRAAFKAVLNGKQVALLVPTTILAFQHFNTFRERLENFPVHIEMLSRFRTNAEQKAIIEKLALGEVDILIGTHRLLSKDVIFKELGLLIIDEEHRFGVSQKEKLKKLRVTVDVLTLTATPIPRTLQFSLMGARDMTHIMTPPKNRLPILTEILPFNKSYIREAILRELERSGQVFFVHNRVRSIERVASMVSELIPEATVAIAHGQMPERDLEAIMVDFMNQKYQILVSTMIIESGLDMPNVNTIVVNRADKLGLAQLYQLRGRVGRSHQRAHAYFIIPPIEILTEDALKRLRAIEEFSEIGSGSQLALRDLEIRGAGNLLGSEQTGFIDTLGFELYNKILDEAVNELKAEKIPEASKKAEIETQVEIDFDAYLPETYVSSGSERVDIYRRLTDTNDVVEIEEIMAELQDRFGRLPLPVTNLLNFLAIRLLGKGIGLKSITINREEMVAEFATEILDFQGEQFKNWVGSMLAKASLPFEFYQNNHLGIRLPIPADNDDKLLLIKEFIKSISLN